MKKRRNQRLTLCTETLRILDQPGLKLVQGQHPQPTTGTCYGTCTCNTTVAGCVVQDFE